MDLAIYSISINPTTGAAERNWSNHSFIHTKLRNSLTNERVQKLVYCLQNGRFKDEMKPDEPAYFGAGEVDGEALFCHNNERSYNNNEIEIEIEIATNSLVEQPAEEASADGDDETWALYVD